MYVVTAQWMRELDRITIEDVGIPGMVLMENAARGVVCAMEGFLGGLRGKGVAIFSGRGNNGGDGLAVGRILLNRDVRIFPFLAGRADALKGEARENLQILRRLGVEIKEITETGELEGGLLPWDQIDVVLDALLGTGLNAEVRGLYRDLIGVINTSRKPVVAVDIPSGLSSDTGRPLGTSVRADLTVTFGLPKLGHLLPPGRELTGRLVVVDIGIPDTIVRERGLPYELVEEGELITVLKPRPVDSHKGSFGHLFVLAGSVGKTGAAVMTSEAALRVGAGLVTLGIPEGLNTVIEAKLTEVMSIPLPETDAGSISLNAWETIMEQLEGKACVAIGPGLSMHPDTQELVRRAVGDIPLPMVVDADGLNALSARMEVLKAAQGPRILTPHPGEMGRLLGWSTSQVQENRLGSALELSRRWGVYTILKGAGTIVTSPEGKAAFIPTGNPALSSAGTGDILTGILAGLICQGLEVMDALKVGTFLHGLLADEWAKGGGDRGLLATDLLDGIPHVLGSWVRGEALLKEERGCTFHVG